MIDERIKAEQPEGKLNKTESLEETQERFHCAQVSFEELTKWYHAQQQEIERLKVNLAFAQSHAGEKYTVQLCIPTTDEPFRKCDAKVVDVGFSSRSLVVECDEIDYLTAENERLAKNAYLLPFYQARMEREIVRQIELTAENKELKEINNE